MKQGHLAVFFLFLYVLCFLLLCFSREQYDTVLQKKYKVEQALLEAMGITGREYAAVLNASGEEKKQFFEESFFESFYTFMGILDEKDEQEKLRMYVPMLILVEQDGVTFNYLQEYMIDGVTELHSIWSEKKSYYDFENETSVLNKQVVEEVLEKEASEIITNHNYIAAQYGIDYLFHVPRFLLDNESEPEFPMLFAVFQGWPLTAAGDIVYENCVDVGVYLEKVERYVVTGPKDLSSPNCVYHKRTCLEMTEKKITYVTEEQAVKMFGALPCKICVQQQKNEIK